MRKLEWLRYIGQILSKLYKFQHTYGIVISVWATSEARYVSVFFCGMNRVRKFQWILTCTRLNNCLYQRSSVQKIYKEKSSFYYIL
jgi:hypothetical protein